MKRLFMLTAAIEVPTGLALAIAPSTLVQLLIGVPLTEHGGLIVARIAGSALLALGAACYMARNDKHNGAASGLLVGMLVYNAAVVAVLVHAGLIMNLSGVGIWPAAALHTGLSAWCVACMRRKSSAY